MFGFLKSLFKENEPEIGACYSLDPKNPFNNTFAVVEEVRNGYVLYYTTDRNGVIVGSSRSRELGSFNRIYTKIGYPK